VFEVAEVEQAALLLEFLIPIQRLACQTEQTADEVPNTRAKAWVCGKGNGNGDNGSSLSDTLAPR
jgi:hypothetical protein